MSELVPQGSLEFAGEVGQPRVEQDCPLGHARMTGSAGQPAVPADLHTLRKLCAPRQRADEIGGAAGKLGVRARADRRFDAGEIDHECRVISHENGARRGSR